MKIIYIANIRLPTEKAHGYQICKMCEAFALSGNEVELVVPRRLNNIHEDPFEYYGIQRNFKVVRLPTLDTIEFGKIGFWIQTLTFNFFAVPCVMFRKNITVYSRDEFTLYVLSLLNFNKNRLVWESHVPKFNFIIKKIVHNVRKIVTITSGLRDFYIEKYKTNDNRFTVAPSGIDLQKFNIVLSRHELRKKLELPLDKKIIEYVGKYKTMGKVKGVDDLIKTFSELTKTEKNIFLLLVGINQDEIEIVNEAFRILQVQESDFKIVSHVNQKEIPGYLKSADILVMSYPDSEHYGLYMSPVKMFEYMASGIPIVSTDLPSIREVLSDSNAVLVAESDFGQGIKKLLHSEVEGRALASRALEDVKKYVWKERVLAILRQ